MKLPSDRINQIPPVRRLEWAPWPDPYGNPSRAGRARQGPQGRSGE
jgi:hypothetical protein